VGLGGHRPAKATGISRSAAKSRCVRKGDGWGRLSDEGAGQHNPCWSEGPWGKAMSVACTVVLDRADGSGSERRSHVATASTKDGGKLRVLDWRRQAPSEMPALKPYWGKPAVRNFREGAGDVTQGLVAICHAARKSGHIGSNSPTRWRACSLLDGKSDVADRNLSLESRRFDTLPGKTNHLTGSERCRRVRNALLEA
jgi:hypothetical protein